MAGRTARILTRVWGEREGFVFLPRKAGAQWIEQGTCYRWPMDFAGLTVPAEHNVYFCPLVFSEPSRRAEYALPTHVLWSDLDYADPAGLSVRPSIAWRTTQGGFGCQTHQQDIEERPRYAALWLLDREVTPQVAAELSRRIAYAEGADKGGWDVTQVLRLPGTFNHKHSPPQRIEVLWAEQLVYDPRQLALVYPKVVVTNHVADTSWPAVAAATVAAALSALPVGVQYMLQRSADGADRSMELLRLAKTLTKLNVPRDVVLHLLDGSSLAQSKFDGRTDAHKVLLQVMEDVVSVRLATTPK